jgi:hypothetical protein
MAGPGGLPDSEGTSAIKLTDVVWNRTFFVPRALCLEHTEVEVALMVGITNLIGKAGSISTYDLAEQMWLFNPQ